MKSAKAPACPLDSRSTRPSAAPRFAIPAIALVAGLSLFARHSAQAANTEYDVVNSRTDLTSAATYSTGGTSGTGVGGTAPAPGAPTVTSDVTFDIGVGYNLTAFTLNSSQTFGSLNDLSTVPLTISNTGTAADTLTLGGAGNLGDGVVGSSAADLLFVGASANLTINGGSGVTALGLVLGQSGNFDIVGTAAISSIISDGGNAFGLTKTGAGNLTLTGVNTYTGGTNLNAGQVTFTTGGLGTTGAITFTGNSILQYGASTTTDLSPRLAINNGVTATIDTNGNNVTFATGFGGGTTGGLTKYGAGTLTLSGAETYTGTTTVNAGTLALSGSLNGTTGTSLALGGGTLAYTAAASTQNFTSTAINQGASAITTVAGSTVTLGAITPNAGGSVDFSLNGTGTITTTTGNSATSILGGWATVGGTDWAVSASTGGAAGNITALGSYTTASATAATNTGANIDVTASTTVGAVTSPNSIRFSGAGGPTLTLATGVNTIASGGILLSSAGTGGTISGGTITAGTGNTLYLVGSKGITINSIIANNGSPVSLVSSTTGGLSLNGVNGYSGGTYLNNAGLNLGGNATAAGTGSIYMGAPGTTNAISIVTSGSSANYANPLVVEPGGRREIYTGSSGAPTYSGGVTLVGGATLEFSPNLNGSITLSGGATGTGNIIFGPPQAGRNATINVSGAIPFSITGTISDLDTLNGNASNSGSVNVSAPIQGATAVLQNSGSAQFVLTGTNTYTGGTNITAGYLDDQLAAALTPNSTTTAGPLGTLVLGVGSAAAFTSANVDSLLANTLAHVSLSSTSGAGLDTTPGNFTYASNTTTSRFLTKIGSNSLILTGADNFLNNIVVSAGTLQLGDGTTDASLGLTPTIVNNAALAFNTATAESYGGVIAGSGTLSKTGAGTLTLSGANFFTGTTTVSAGTLNLSNSLALQNSVLQSGGTGLVFDSSVASHAFAIGGLNGGTTLALTDSAATPNPVALTLHPNGTQTYNSALTGSGSLTMAGVGTQVLGGANTYTGGTTVSLGTLRLDFAQTNAPTSNILYNGSVTPGTLTMGGVGLATNADGIPGANLTVLGKASTTNIQNFGGLTVNPGISNITITPGATGGGVQLSFAGALTHNTGGLINFTPGTLAANNFINLGTTVNDATGIIGGYATVNNTAYASVDGNGQVIPYTYTTTVGAGGMIADSGAGTATNVQLNGAVGTETLSGTTNGATNINTLTNSGTGAQTLTIGAGNTLRLGANGGILQGSGQALTIGTSNVGTLTAGGNAYGTAGEISLINRGSGGMTINSVIANNNANTGVTNSTGGGAVTLTVGETNGGATTYYNLAGSNTYSGGTYLLGSRVQASTTTSYGTGPVYVLPGAQAYLNASGTYANTFNIGGIGANESGFNFAIRFVNNANTTISGNLNLLGDAAIANNSNDAITGNLTGTGSLNLFGGNTFTLGSANSTDTITGNLSFNGFVPGVPNTAGANNTYKLGGAGALPNGTGSGNVIINGGAVAAGTNVTLDVNGFSASTNGLISSGANVASALITNSGASAILTIGNNNANASFGGRITDSGTGKTLGIMKNGAGTQAFSGVNTYSGGTTIAGGILVTGNTGTLGTGNVTAMSGATLTLGNTASIAATGSLLFVSTTTAINLNYTGTDTIAMVMNMSTGAFEPAGTYNATQLNSDLGAPNLFSGVGTLTVAPEPSTWAMMVCGLASTVVTLRVRRRRA